MGISTKWMWQLAISLTTESPTIQHCLELAKFQGQAEHIFHLVTHLLL